MGISPLVGVVCSSLTPQALFGLVLGEILQLLVVFWEQTGTTVPWQHLILIFFSRESSAEL